MKRAASDELSAWLGRDGRKPLIIRGARQVGKTWLVRNLARNSGLDLVEVNFEQSPLAARWFSSNDPRQILGELSLAIGRDVLPGKSLHQFMFNKGLTVAVRLDTNPPSVQPMDLATAGSGCSTHC